mmetsp:Transcript_144024/g.460381  ORF Transcript_144024/g.460381 Transcript_144024/m.460381 type:complete len:112 (+) Transcript_144024:53-388(+)
MVRATLSRCHFCNVDLKSSQDAAQHGADPQHLDRMYSVLSSPLDIEKLAQSSRPTEDEKRKLKECMRDLRKVLECELMFVGSVAKGTALSGALDLDVVARCGDCTDRWEAA